MKRNFIYLAIFALFFWTLWFTLAWLVSPTDSQGHYLWSVITLFFGLLFGAVTMTVGLITSIIKSLLPNRKLPVLLLRDSLIQGAVGGGGVVGLLMLQLWRVGSLLNIVLWLAILASIEWYVIQRQSLSRYRENR